MALYRDGLAAFGVFQQGTSHIKKNTPCQDYGAIRMLKNGPVSVAAIADGVGSCEMSHYGSMAAVQAALKTVCERLQPLAEDPSFVFENDVVMKEVMTQAFEAAVDAVEEKADEMERLPYSYQSTLTLAIYNGKTLYFAHAGDDGIVALCQDGTCQMVTVRHKGEAANSVFPLQSGNWQFGKADREVVGFVMMTDGVLDQVVGSTLYDNRVYYPFFQPIFEAKINGLHEAQECGNEISQYLQSPAYRERVKDDITLVAVLNQNTIHNSRKPVWDANKWEEQTQEVNRKVNEKLYPDENKPQKPASPVKPEAPRPVKKVPVSQKLYDNRRTEPVRDYSQKPDDQQLSGKFPAYLYESGRIKSVVKVYREKTTRDGRIQQFFVDAKERLAQPTDEILDILFGEKKK
ncbi:MAG TPA: protein phosphatase 2C domain-containing protein [Candidatus Gallacutalibacter pullistercoris]|nr:protein phosphatase 2C domain-containing protein [Candidatus Gallacutalibacter pullistercoris]